MKTTESRQLLAARELRIAAKDLTDAFETLAYVPPCRCTTCTSVRVRGSAALARIGSVAEELEKAVLPDPDGAARG